jgi:microcystin degradation protein MlrC
MESEAKATTKRVFAGALATESNTFSPIATTLQDYFDCVYFPAGQHPSDRATMFSAPLWAARARCDELGWELIEGMCAFALPGGPTTREAWARLRNELLEDVRSSLPLDAVLLGLHGAMTAAGCEDCEGDLLGAIRSLCGPKTFIAATLDPHSHLTERMQKNSDLLIAFKFYPHTDVHERASELVEITARALRGDVRPVTRSRDCEMIAMFYTNLPPVADLVGWMMRAEQQPEVLSVSLIHGFASGDVADMGSRVMVVTDGQPHLANALADSLRKKVIALRGRSEAARMTVRQAVAEVQNAIDRPVVIADGADNPGGGAPGDSTHMIRALLDAGVSNIAAGPIWDPMAASLLAEWGEGASLDIRIGGKVAPSSGQPLDLRVTIIRVIRGAEQGFAGSTWPLGDLVAVRSGVTELLICSIRNQCFSRSIFEDAGIDLQTKEAVIVKSNQHFHDAFESLAAKVIHLGAPGVNAVLPSEMFYEKARHSLWPLQQRH